MVHSWAPNKVSLFFYVSFVFHFFVNKISYKRYFWINLTGSSHPVVFSVRFSILFLNSNIKEKWFLKLSLAFLWSDTHHMLASSMTSDHLTSMSATTRKHCSVFMFTFLPPCTRAWYARVKGSSKSQQYFNSDTAHLVLRPRCSYA